MTADHNATKGPADRLGTGRLRLLNAKGRAVAQQRDFPYIWTTWLPRLLTGENSCEWAVWFKAQHRDWTRMRSDFNQAQWMLNHTALVNERRTNWENGGFDVAIEGQNSFQLRGRSATLAGRPDIIASRDDKAVIVDAKTEQESPSHIIQVMIYLYAVPKALERYRDLELSGQVTYKDHTVRVPAEAVSEQFVKSLGDLILRIAKETPARRVPSAQECRFCDITDLDCPERLEGAEETAEAATEDF